MDLDLLFRGKSFFHEEFGNSFSMVSLQLNNLTISLISNNCTIATPTLFKMSHKLLEIDVVWQSLDDSDTLSDSTLLELNMNHLLFSFNLFLTFIDSSNFIKLIFDQIVLQNIVVVHVVFKKNYLFNYKKAYME